MKSDRRKIKISEVCDLNRKSIGRHDAPRLIKYLDTANVTRNEIAEVQVLDADLDTFPSRAKRRVKDNTIIYSTVRPNLEHFGLISNPPENLIVSTGFLTLDVCDDELDPKFLYYCLTRKELTEYLHSVAVNNVSSYPSLNPDDIGNLRLEVPRKLDEQKRIAAVLSALDAKIEVNKRINAELEAMAKTLYDYWFVQFDFPDQNGRPYKTSGGKMTYNKTLKREIPKDWQVVSLANFASISKTQINPLSYPSKTFRHYSIPAFDESGSYALERGDDIRSNKFVVGESDLLISRLNPQFPRIVFCGNEEDTIASTEFAVMRTGRPEVKAFLYQVSTDPAFTRYCVRSSSGTSHSHKRIDGKVMIAFPFAVDRKKVIEYGRITNPMIQQIQALTRETRELACLRDWLLPMLMNGQVRVIEV